LDNETITANSRPLKAEPGAPAQVGSGMNFPIAKLIEIFEPAQWEDFTEEWAHSLKPAYKLVTRWTGAGDMGLDIFCFSSNNGFDGPWDNYQCKRYAQKLTPTDIWVELGKVIYYSHAGAYTVPESYYFAASQGIGLKLKRLLLKPADLKKGLIDNWSGYCLNGITETKAVPLEGDLLSYLNKFDFRIFKMKSVVEMIAGHMKTPYHQRRFGTASFPERPPVQPAPDEIQPVESRYIEQLFDVYSEKLSVQLSDRSELAKHKEMQEHFNRSRQLFYHAESLRNFPRDSVDPGAFDAIREEIYHGVVDTYEMDYADGLTRVRSTLKHAAMLTPNCNALCIRVQTQDKQGLCHHLANENRLQWVKKNG
jgi:hypothetical protein